MSEKLKILSGVVVLFTAGAFLAGLAAVGAVPAAAAEAAPTVAPDATVSASSVAPGRGVLPGGSPQPLPLAKCDFCDTSPFNPRFGIRCTFADDCRKGANGCCEYTCACGTDTGRSTPANACALDLPTNCCPRHPCQVSYCGGEGILCVANGCGVGCCSYECGPGPGCPAPDPLPPGAC